MDLEALSHVPFNWLACPESEPVCASSKRLPSTRFFSSQIDRIRFGKEESVCAIGRQAINLRRVLPLGITRYTQVATLLLQTVKSSLNDGNWRM